MTVGLPARTALTAALLAVLAALPILHAHLTMTGAITGPEAQDDFACLSCHGGNRGHVVPPDRSCLSCHALDFGRHSQTLMTTLHPESIRQTTLILAASHLLLALALFAYLRRPRSLPRLVLLVAGAGWLVSLLAVLFGAGR